jgi:NAD(P)-dependent dehydrogenase (short-subunit alcohol dehydrogenase family)
MTSTPARDSNRLRDRVAIVTGGGHNIGRAIAVAFAAEGARVMVCGRRAHLLDGTVQAIAHAGGAAAAFAADLTDPAAALALVEATCGRFGTVDIVAAMAGGGAVYAPLDELAPATFEAIFKQNVGTTFHTLRAVLPVFRRQNRGVAITAAGGGAFFPWLGVHASAYAAAKAAVCRLTDQLQAELLDTPIRLNVLEPGMVWSAEKLSAVEAEEKATGRPHPLRPHCRPPEAAAELAVWLASDASASMQGRCVSVNDDWWRDPARVRRVAQTVHHYRLRRYDLF